MSMGIGINIGGSLKLPVAQASPLLDGLALSLNPSTLEDNTGIHAITNHNGVTPGSFAAFNSALAQYLSIPATGDLQLAGHDLTIRIDFEFTGQFMVPTGSGYLIALAQDEPYQEAFTLYSGKQTDETGFLDFELSDSNDGYPFVETPRNLTLATRYHLLLWIDQTALTINIQIGNGPVISTPITGGAYSGFAYADDMTIGVLLDPAEYPTYLFNGKIYALEIWGKVLTPDAQAQLIAGAVYPFI
jgi:hypothetical protein